MAANDKIFNNSFDAPDFELTDITFDLDPSFKDNRDEEIKIHFEMISTKIHELIEASRFKTLSGTIIFFVKSITDFLVILTLLSLLELEESDSD